MIRNYWLWFWIVLPAFAFTPAEKADTEFFTDLSSPEKSFDSFVSALKSGNAANLAEVATESGIESLQALSSHSDYKGQKEMLGQELEKTQVSYIDITDEIVLASAESGKKMHKMEFVETENGWKLYHWQIGSPEGVNH